MPFDEEPDADPHGECAAEIARLRSLNDKLWDAGESALACLRHTHDRLIDNPEFETLRITINAECRTLRATLDNKDGGNASSTQKD